MNKETLLIKLNKNFKEQQKKLDIELKEYLQKSYRLYHSFSIRRGLLMRRPI